MWPFSREKRARQGIDLAEQPVKVVDDTVGVSTNSPGAPPPLPPDPQKLAIVKSCAALVGRCFAAATVGGEERSKLVTPQLLGRIGHDIVSRGESVALLEGEPITIRPAVSYSVAGGSGDPRRWTYKADVSTPSSTVSYTVPAEGIIHAVFFPDQRNPYRGASPVSDCHSANLLAEIEVFLTREGRLPSTRILGVGRPLNSEQRDTLQRSIVTSGYGILSGQSHEVDATRKIELGPQIPSFVRELRADLVNELCFLCAIPPELIVNGSGASDREAFRRFIFSTLVPWGEILSSELSAKLETEITLDFDKLAQGDILSRSRAFKSLTGNAEIPVDVAASLVGFDISQKTGD